MASIKDAFEEALQDNLAALKYIIYAAPLFYCTYLYTTADKDYTGFWWMASITFLLLFGFMLKCTSNVRKGLDHVLPSFNIFGLFWDGIKGLVALGPSIAINCWLASLIIGQVNIYIPDPNVNLVFKIIVWSVFGAIMLTGYMLYAKNFKISDAYNLKVISESSMDILVRIIFMVPGLAVIDGLIVGAVTYVIWVFVGLPNMFCTYFWCVAAIFNLAIIGNYIAQVDYESIEIKNEKDF